MPKIRSTAACQNGLLHVGSTVQYSAAFCRSTGQQIGNLPNAKGQVAAFTALGDTVFVDVEWNLDDVPSRVNSKNLVLAGVPDNA